MSVDLMGSTAFKGMDQYSNPENGQRHPGWVNVFRMFYQEFPKILANSYTRACVSDNYDDLKSGRNHPKVWKTVGDEIVFCNRVVNIDHAAMSVSAFVKALDEFSEILEKNTYPLKVKGSGWLAAFPAPNISIKVFTNESSSKDELETTPNSPTAIGDVGTGEEEMEANADSDPHKFDFLGKGIDTGFRIAKNATEDRFVVSAQLGYVLARASSKKRFSHALGYHGRESLKGVVGGAPYPVISIDTERSELQSKLKSREFTLTGQKPVSPFALIDFLETFLEAAKIEFPYLCFRDEELDGSRIPATYQTYERVFKESMDADNKKMKALEEGIDPVDVDVDALANSLEFLDQFTTENASIDMDSLEDRPCLPTTD